MWDACAESPPSLQGLATKKSILRIGELENNGVWYKGLSMKGELSEISHIPLHEQKCTNDSQYPNIYYSTVVTHHV